MCHVSPLAHCNTITLLSESKPLEPCLMHRFCKFGKTIFQKGSPLIQSISNIVIYTPRSIFGMNYCEIRCKYHDDFNTVHVMIDNIVIYEPRSVFDMNYCEIRCKYDDDFNTAHIKIDENWNDSLNYRMIQSVNVLKDMIDVRDCVKECAVLNMDDVMYIINDICLN